jgi:hypothetical protein
MGRTFFHCGGLELTADVTIDRPAVKELAALSARREGVDWLDRERN